MNTSRLPKLAVTALAVAASALLFAAQSTPASGSSSVNSGREVLTLAVPWTGGHQQYVDLGAKGMGPGDLFLTTDVPVLNNTTGARIGTTDGVELIVSALHDGTVTNQMTFRLPGGHVDVNGVVRHTDQPFRVPVVGGTGRYARVRGQLTLLREDERRKVEVFQLDLRH